MNFSNGILILFFITALSPWAVDAKQACSGTAGWPAFGAMSKDTSRLYGQLQPQIDDALRKRGYNPNTALIFQEQQGEVLSGDRVIRAQYPALTDGKTVWHLLIDPSAGKAAAFLVENGMIDSASATDRRQISQFNSMLKEGGAGLDGESTALLYVRLSLPFDEANQTCIEEAMKSGKSAKQVRLRTNLPGGSWLQWSVLVDSGAAIKKVSFKHHRAD